MIIYIIVCLKIITFTQFSCGHEAIKYNHTSQSHYITCTNRLTVPTGYTVRPLVNSATSSSPHPFFCFDLVVVALTPCCVAYSAFLSRSWASFTSDTCGQNVWIGN